MHVINPGIKDQLGEIHFYNYIEETFTGQDHTVDAGILLLSVHHDAQENTRSLPNRRLFLRS